jgi:hypothetical protein
MRGCWEGDVDLNDGSLRLLREEYQGRCSEVRKICKGQQLNLTDVQKLKKNVENDVDFLKNGDNEASDVYNKAVEGKRCGENKLMELAWNATGFQELLKTARKLIMELEGVLDGGAIKDLAKLMSCLLQYNKDLFSKKRVAANYLLVFMISDELRNRKPYAVPVQFIPYKSLSDSKLRDLQVKVEKSMKDEGMTVVGMYNT